MIHTLSVGSVILEFGSRRVLQDVYLECKTGKLTGLLGRNGAGKTCLMNIITGKLKPLNGMVRIDHEALLEGSIRNGNMMYLPQFAFIPKFLTLNRIFKDYKLSLQEFTQVFPEFKKSIGSKIGTLSGGERRIVEIYLVIASETKFCLLDEPFSHVMPLHIERIKDLIKKENQRKGILITDHLYEHIVEMCDKIYLVKDGTTHLINHIGEIESLGYAKIKPENLQKE